MSTNILKVKDNLAVKVGKLVEDKNSETVLSKKYVVNVAGKHIPDHFKKMSIFMWYKVFNMMQSFI